MFINGIYSAAEKEMLEEWNEKAERDVGWLGDEPDFRSATPVNIREADEMVIAMVARNHDYKNRLYRDSRYARASRWGRIIAPPMFMLTIGYGCAHFLRLDPAAGTYVGCHFGEEFDFYRPIYAGDVFKVYQGRAVLKDETPPGEQPRRILAVYDRKYYYSLDDEPIGVFTHVIKNIYAEPGTPYGKIMGYGYENDFGLNKSFENVRWTAEYRYTKEELDCIAEIYANEPRRGAETRYWEDVHAGEVLPPVIIGPITEWDTVGAMATHAESTLNMMELRRLNPGMLFIDPETNVPHQGAEIHLTREIPKLIGWYSPTIVEHTINSFLCRLVSNWMGDDGFITHFGWRKFANTSFGDTVIGRGRVVRKYVNEKGECLADIDTCMENIRGFVANMGPVTVKLPSRSETFCGAKPAEPDETALALNPRGIGAGDRFRVKDRPDWELPGAYPLAGRTGTVYELPLDYDGYIYAVMDDDCTGLDPRVVVGFRMDRIEKL